MPTISSKPLKPGDIISELKPLFVCVTGEFRGSHCDNCLKKSDSLKRCSKCLEMYYCDKSCQINDWKYHKKECKIFTKFIICCLPVLGRLLLRLCLCLKSDPEFATKGHKVVDGSEVCLNDIKVDAKAFNSFMKKDFFIRTGFELIFDQFRAYGLKIEHKELFHWLGVALRLIHPIKIYDKNPIFLFRSVYEPIGYGLYIQLSSVNHSCVPNSGLVSNGLSLQMRAIKSIDSGNELTVTFIILTNNKSKRQELLRPRQLDGCQCDKCRLDLDKGFDYIGFELTLERHMKHFITMSNPWLNFVISKWYSIDSEMIRGLRQIYGEFDPRSTDLIAMSFVCFSTYSSLCHPFSLTLWYDKISKVVAITHGKQHPLYKLIADVYYTNI